MTEQQWLSLALANMHSGQWFGWKKDWTGEHRMSYENIIVHDSSITKPTETEVNAKIQELKDAEANAETKKTSAKQKLIDLGLTEEEIKSLLGV
jgi:hypothetical protein